ncbi:MAG: hypothetical protein DRO88_03170 [Promethearchaeia archaeon]|nr:MAG: hypothetical protein DRO88_03170 [Candidatus Lokiarchaeia archaeon]
MEIDLSTIPLDQLDLTLVFWDEILSSGSSVEEEIRLQVWSYLYNSVLDEICEEISETDDLDLQNQIEKYMDTPEIQEWLAKQATKIHDFLQK